MDILLRSTSILHACALLLCGTGVAAASADPLPAPAIAAARALAADAARAQAPPGARVDVTAGALDTRLRLAACDRIEPRLLPGTRAWGTTRVGLRCTQGAAWNAWLPLTVRVWAPAPVSPTALATGDVIDAARLARADVEWSADPSAVVARAEDLHGRTVARPVAAGSPLRLADLHARQWFAAGDTVRVVASGNGFSLSAEGQALSAGVAGRTARVLLANGRIVGGMPVGERRIDVSL